MNLMNFGVVDISHVTTVTNQKVTPSGTSTIPQSHTQTFDSSHHGTHKKLHKLNENLQTSSVKIVSVFDKRSNRIWLNIVDKSTGKVVSKIPPEAIREIVDSFVPVQGMSFDKRL